MGRGAPGPRPGRAPEAGRVGAHEQPQAGHDPAPPSASPLAQAVGNSWSRRPLPPLEARWLGWHSSCYSGFRPGREACTGGGGPGWDRERQAHLGGTGRGGCIRLWTAPVPALQLRLLISIGVTPAQTRGPEAEQLHAKAAPGGQPLQPRGGPGGQRRDTTAQRQREVGPAANVRSQAQPLNRGRRAQDPPSKFKENIFKPRRQAYSAHSHTKEAKDCYWHRPTGQREDAR